MLRQLIYQSTASLPVARDILQAIRDDSLPFNERHNVTGILLFDGVHFFQVLEAESETVYRLLDRIKDDGRHYQVTIISDTTIRERDFTDWHLQTIKVDKTLRAGYWVPYDIGINRDSRVFRLLNSFATGRWQNVKKPVYPPADSVLQSQSQNQHPIALPITDYQGYTFAYQPIVDTYNGEMTSIEALLRDDQDVFPCHFFNGLPPEVLYAFDLQSKAVAIGKIAGSLPASCSLSVNLLPGSLARQNKATAFIERLIDQHKLEPEKLIIEITESEMIGHYDELISKVEALRALGVRFAIDDFGAGYAGLSLLAKFIPDKIKLDRALITDIDSNGPKQAIVKALVEFSVSMGIPLIAEGIEKPEEWSWLSAHGIHRFQGFLFARPNQHTIAPINWEALSPATDVAAL